MWVLGRLEVFSFGVPKSRHMGTTAGAVARSCRQPTLFRGTSSHVNAITPLPTNVFVPDRMIWREISGMVRCSALVLEG